MKRIAVIGLHVGYWLMYGILILLFVLITLISSRHFVPRYFWRVLVQAEAAIFLAIPAILAFYTFYTILFTRFLQKKKLWLLFGSAIVVSFLSAVLTLVVLNGIAHRIKFGFSWDSSMAVLFLAIVALVNGILGLVMRGFITWYGDIRLKEELSRRNVEMELALIKSQLSPHFLFNTLNNIDVLIGKDADRASDYLKKLSDMLRFMLYETKTAQIPIARELGYIEKYIELQRIRTSNPDAIDYIVEGQPGGLMVEPMLFIPFIENAFKHGQWREDHSIRVRFVLGAEKIVFNCENTYGGGAAFGGGGPHDGAAVRGGVADSPGGLGNALIRKRLLLLYPDRHTLDINAGNQLYQATLTLAAHAN